jgi:hypothetical protein
MEQFVIAVAVVAVLMILGGVWYEVRKHRQVVENLVSGAQRAAGTASVAGSSPASQGSIDALHDKVDELHSKMDVESAVSDLSTVVNRVGDLTRQSLVGVHEKLDEVQATQTDHGQKLEALSKPSEKGTA